MERQQFDTLRKNLSAYGCLLLKYSILLSGMFLCTEVTALENNIHKTDGQIPNDAVLVEHSQIVTPPPGAPTAKGYFTLWNGSSEYIYLSKISSKEGLNISIHKTFIEGDIARMRPVDLPIIIPPRTEFVTVPGRFHLMISPADNDLFTGSYIPLQFTFRNGVQIDSEAVVLPMGTAPIDHHHGIGDNK